MSYTFILFLIYLSILFFIVEFVFLISLNRFWKKNDKPKSYIYATTIISIFTYISFIAFAFFRTKYPLVLYFSLAYNILSVLMFPKLILFPFLLLGNIIQFIKKQLVKEKKQSEAVSLTRRKFIANTGLLLGTLPFMAALWGSVYNKNSLRKRVINIYMEKFPEVLNGFCIAQISDLHFGSFSSTKEFSKLCDLINYTIKPDLLFITGDFVNFSSQELLPYISYLNNLQAKYGKFAVLGNHDYYVENVNEIIDLLQQTDVKLLQNECVNLDIHAAQFQIAGVDNYERNLIMYKESIKKTFENINESDICFLLCHDPIVWDEYILNKQPADITFAGHTHGGQIAVPFSDGKLAPAKILNKRIEGLYHESQQYLYVNTGFGTTSLNARIGTMPEITIFNFMHVNNIVKNQIY